MGNRNSATLDKIASSEPNTNAIQQAISRGTVSAKISPDLVKGTRVAGETPVSSYSELQNRQMLAEKTFQAAIKKGFKNPQKVIEGLSPQFQWALGNAQKASPYGGLNNLVDQLNTMLSASLGRSFTLTSPLSTGLVPFDLVAPSQLIYPVYSPLRNRFPRVPGQGTSHRAKVITKIQGALPGILANPSQRVSISEFPSGGSFANWPAQLPGSGSQSAVDLNIPYKFFGLTEAVSWLGQFAGQGFDDLAALASLVLLQEMMLAEERAILGGTAFNISAPASVTGTARTAGTGETAITGFTTNIYVTVTAVNYYGETVGVMSAAIPVATGDVVDITITPTAANAGLAFNIYEGTGSTTPANSAMYLLASGVGGVLYTIQGAVPTSGANPPTADTGTGSSTDYEGMVSLLSGHAAANSIYPSGYEAGYINQAVGNILDVDVVNAALVALWDGSSGYLADPAEMWVEGSDAANLNNSLVATGGTQNYTIFISQNELANTQAGVAVSQITNPVTRSVMKITVHPYLPQGTAIPVSYTLPQVQTNVSNVWENVMVQDYLSINWPVIDVTFRYSMFMYGTLYCPAPMYNGLIQGLQRSASKPYS